VCVCVCVCVWVRVCVGACVCVCVCVRVWAWAFGNAEQVYVLGFQLCFLAVSQRAPASVMYTHTLCILQGGASTNQGTQLPLWLASRYQAVFVQCVHCVYCPPCL
jgi:hypothetical protein